MVAALIAGCGSGDSSTSGNTKSVAGSTATDSSTAAGAGGGGTTLVAALGDSITSGSPGYDPDPASAAALGFGQDPRSSFEYWAQKANPKLEFRNCGVFGERTDEIATRLKQCADGADALVIQGGINDIAQSLQGGKPASLKAATTAAKNISGMIDQAQKLDIPIAVTNVLPWNNGHPVADDAIDQLNASIEQIAKKDGIELLQFHDTLEDSSGEQIKPGLTADGDHPSVAGYKLLGEKAFQLPAN
ncbi:hypothetical protein BH10ACT11_BH10ACT11_10280 [soil metagenome]